MVCHSRPCKALCVAGGGVLPIPATLGVQCGSSGSCAAATGVAASTGSALSGFRLIATPRRNLAGLDAGPVAGSSPEGGEGGPRLGNPWLRPRREATAGPAATPAPTMRMRSELERVTSERSRPAEELSLFREPIIELAHLVKRIDALDRAVTGLGFTQVRPVLASAPPEIATLLGEVFVTGARSWRSRVSIRCR